MSVIFARKALVAESWVDDVRLEISGDRIRTVEPGSEAATGDLVVDRVVPGVPNAHSHAFQRALVGHTEFSGGATRDNFWSWRSQMYRLVEQMDPTLVEAIASQLYVEMVTAGYTSVAEFHYLHGASTGAPSDEMLDALRQAAHRAGIRLAYVPVYYERAGFDGSPPTRAQQRFVWPLDHYLDHCDRVTSQSEPLFSVGLGAHSLRAVSPDALYKIEQIARRDGVPMHIHVAEQTGEVEACEAHLGVRPVRWLLDHHDIDASWCLVHATHLDEQETVDLARSNAVVCLCPSTEGNLGDGLFPLSSFLGNDGRVAIGSDSHVTIDPFEELRWLEYGQRLISRTRNVAATRNGNTGSSLFTRALRGGAQALGFTGRGFSAGGPADLIVLDGANALLAGHSDRTIADALVFTGIGSAIDRVMVGGEWQVLGGVHRAAETTQRSYVDAVERLRRAS